MEVSATYINNYDSRAGSVSESRVNIKNLLMYRNGKLVKPYFYETNVLSTKSVSPKVKNKPILK